MTTTFMISILLINTMPFIARTTPNIIELILSFKLYEINDKSNLDQNYKSNYDHYWALEFYYKKHSFLISLKYYYCLECPTEEYKTCDNLLTWNKSMICKYVYIIVMLYLLKATPELF